MDNIGVCIDGLSQLKVLIPVVNLLVEKANVFLIHYTGVTQKGYDLPTIKKLNAVIPSDIKNLKAMVSYNNKSQISTIANKYKLNKIISVESSIVMKESLNSLYSKKIKIYSLQYLTDSMWSFGAHYNKIHRIYFPTQFIMDCCHKFNSINKNNSALMLGSPIFDDLNMSNQSDSGLLLLPNIRSEHIGLSFKNRQELEKIVGNITLNNDILTKSRKKQWSSDVIKKYCDPIIYDEDPFVLPKLIGRTKTTILFSSSGIYEAIIGGNYVYNISLSYKMFRHNKKNMKEYFDEIYNFKGVVETVSISDALNKTNWVKDIDLNARKKWLERFVGDHTNSAKKIAKDILNS